MSVSVRASIRHPVTVHTPVLLHEVITFLAPQAGGFVIDGTLGGGGYAAAIIPLLAPGGTYLGFDWDLAQILGAVPRIREQEMHGVKLVVVNDNFAHIQEFVQSQHYGKATGIVLDLGLSSDQLERSGRGFSFQKNEPLLMTYDERREPVRSLLHRLTAHELRDVLREYGEERYAAKIAETIKARDAAHPIVTTFELVRAILASVPKGYEHGRIHPATRTFMALRMYANRELENLEHILGALPSFVQEGGRAVIVSFQSHEDRLVKRAFQRLEKAGSGRVLTKKPVTAAKHEILQNPRSRSAKLRAIEFRA